MSGDLEAIIPVPGRRQWSNGVFLVLMSGLMLLGIPFLFGWGLGGKLPIAWGQWLLWPVFLVMASLNLLKGVSRLAAEPRTLIIRAEVIEVERRGCRWSSWVAPPNQIIPRDAAEFLQGYGKLVLADRKRHASSLILAEGNHVGPLAQVLATNGVEVQRYGDQA